MDKPKSSGGFLGLFDIEIEATIRLKTQVYADSENDAIGSGHNLLDDIIGDDAEIWINKSIATPVKEEEDDTNNIQG